MRNLTRPSQYETAAGSCFDTGTEGLVLFSPSGDKVRLHVGADGFLYINNQPFGVQGMPPALHAIMHAKGGADAVSPASIGAVAQSMLTAEPAPGRVPVLGADGLLDAAFMAAKVPPASHAAAHAAGGQDAISPASIKAVADNDPRLENRRWPLNHAHGHARGQPDAVSPASIGAVPLDDGRLTDRRVPLNHAGSHHKNGPDPLSWADVGAVDEGRLTVRDRMPGGVPQLNDVGHIDINLLPQYALRPALHAATHDTDGVDRIIPESIGAADRKHQHGNADIRDLDAAKLTSGVLDLARIPVGALERLVPVDDMPAMLALSRMDVQNGDTVQRLDTGLMYRVVAEGLLGSMGAFREYNAGRAAAVPWEGVEGKPSAYNPEAHAVRHHAGGVDALSPADIGAPDMKQMADVRQVAATGVEHAENARVLAVAAQSTANAAQSTASKALADAKAAHNNANTRALKTDVNAMKAQLEARIAALESAAVTSSNIRAIYGAKLPDGVGTLEFESK